MTTHEIRKRYLDFFRAKQHVILPSASLLPENDPTTLFTGSGMQPMVPYLLGETHPAGKRLADSQKCFRAQDMDEVGDNRHTTFFEMLGNWSLGDYFKSEQIPWMFEFLTDKKAGLGLDANRLFVTVFRGNESLKISRDEEAIVLWQKAFASCDITATVIDDAEKNGMQGGRIFSYDEKKNWWSRAGIPSNMPVGEPGGPDTEMFWDFGTPHNPSFGEHCHLNCDCGRFMEIGNNVFMQYKKTENGFELLKQPNVDFGGGLERMAAAVLHDPDIFNIDLFAGARAALEHASGKKYGANTDETFAFRVVLDHIRAALFLIADGASPSNKEQGYVTRRLIRRAVLRARTVGVSGAVVRSTAEAYIETYANIYPELQLRRDHLLSTIEEEETKFAKALDQGLAELNKQKNLDAKGAFDIFQSYGFPLELIQEELARRGLKINPEEFALYAKQHQDRSRGASEQKFAGGLADHSEQVVRGHTATHLLHQALRMVLGDGVGQKGSNITAERLRFDFSHPQKVTPEELEKVQEIVREQIKRDLPVRFELLDVAEAKVRGAIGLFEDKYAQLGGKIKVYFVGDDTNGCFSSEICGGPHVAKTGDIISFTILKEEAVSSGIRRIKAKVG